MGEYSGHYICHFSCLKTIQCFLSTHCKGGMSDRFTSYHCCLPPPSHTHTPTHLYKVKIIYCNQACHATGPCPLKNIKNFISAGGEVWWHLKVWVAERPPVPTCGPPLLLIARINHIRASLRSTDSTAMQQFSSVQQQPKWNTTSALVVSNNWVWLLK